MLWQKLLFYKNLRFPFLPEQCDHVAEGQWGNVSRRRWLSFQAWPIKSFAFISLAALFLFWGTEAATPRWPWTSHVKDGRAAISLDSCTTIWSRTTYLNLQDCSISTVWSHCVFVSVLLAQPSLPELMPTVTRTPRILAPQETPMCVPPDGTLFSSVTYERNSAVSLTILLKRCSLPSLCHPEPRIYSCCLCHPGQPDPQPAVPLNAHILDTWLCKSLDTGNWVMCSPAPPSRSTGFHLKILEEEEYYFHIKINTNGQNARWMNLDEFQRPSIRLQRDFKLTFAVLDQVLRAPLGYAFTVLCVVSMVLYLLLS